MAVWHAFLNKPCPKQIILGMRGRRVKTWLIISAGKDSKDNDLEPIISMDMAELRQQTASVVMEGKFWVSCEGEAVDEAVHVMSQRHLIIIIIIKTF